MSLPQLMPLALPSPAKTNPLFICPSLSNPSGSFLHLRNPRLPPGMNTASISDFIQGFITLKKNGDMGQFIVTSQGEKLTSELEMYPGGPVLISTSR